MSVHAAAAASPWARGDVGALLRWAVGGLVCLVAIALYLPSLQYGFVYDDLDLVLGGAASDGTSWLPYRPLRWLSYGFDRALGGGEPWAYHATNIALHGGTVGLAYALALRLGTSVGGAALAACWFAVHPLATEVVAYVAGRRDLLATAATLAAALAWSAGRPRTALVVALVAVAGKETGLFAFVVIGALAALGFGPALSARAIPLVAAFAAALAFTQLYGAIGPWLPGFDIDSAATLTASAGHYAEGVALLRPPSAVHPEFVATLAQGVAGWGVGHAVGLFGGALVLAAMLFAIRAGTSVRARAAALVAVLAGALTVTVGALHEPGADRHGYPLLAFLVPALGLLVGTRGLRAIAAAALAVVTIAGAAVTLDRLPVWASEATLWTVTAAERPRSARAQHNLGRVLLERREYRAAAARFRRAARRGGPPAAVALGRAAAACGRHRPIRVRAHLRDALEAGASAQSVATFGRGCSLPEFSS